jgi:hypothetical protein
MLNTSPDPRFSKQRATGSWNPPVAESDIRIDAAHNREVPERDQGNESRYPDSRVGVHEFRWYDLLQL